MTNINQLNQKLDDLFDEIIMDPTPTKPVERPVRWTWECNDQGYYSGCSPEVKEILGIEPTEFIGKPLSSYQLTPQSSRKLEVLLATLVDEDQINVQFRNNSGYSIPIQMKIYLSQSEDTKGWILHGINQVLSGW